MTDRMTANGALMARLNAMERRIEQLESWTGADENGNWTGDETSVAEQLLAQDAIITGLLRHLETASPGFSIADMRERILQVEDVRFETMAATLDMPLAEAREMHERSRRIIADLLPTSRYDRESGDQRRTRRLSVVVSSSPDDVEPSAQP